MPFRVLAPLALLLLAAGAGCSKTDVSMQNDLKGTPPVVARGGIPDDSIKPKLTPVVGKGGIADDGVKTAPQPLPAPQTINRGGVPDDSVKPRVPGATPPKP